MYRDSRPSVAARAEELEGQLALARTEAETRRDEVAPLALQLFPLFENLGHTLEPIRRGRGGGFSYLMLFAAMSLLSLALLPLAILYRPARRDLRATRRARREVHRLESKLGEAQQTLRALTAGSGESP